MSDVCRDSQLVSPFVMKGPAMNQNNRRHEPRYCTSRQPSVQWVDGPWPACEHDALLHDLSASGIALMICADEQPNIGDSISVRLGPMEAPQAYEVVRTCESQDRQMMIGCQRNHPATIVAPAPYPSTNAQISIGTP